MSETATSETTSLANGSTDLWIVADLELLPDDGQRYEIIGGELFVSKSPHWNHQETCGNIFAELQAWARPNRNGRVAINPGIIFSDTDSVIPDVVWVSNERLHRLLDERGHLTGAPDLVIEVLSPGVANVRRDQEAKRKLYSTRGVREYWIVDWRTRQLFIYRRNEAALTLVATLHPEDDLTSPLLPGFRCPLARLLPAPDEPATPETTT